MRRVSVAFVGRPIVELWFAVALVAVWPIALLFVYRDWIFSSINGQVDPWFYLGYMLDLPQHIRAFPDLYYGTRLSWLLPGYLAYQAFPPLEANYVLHLLTFYAAAYAVFFTLRATVGLKVALTTTVLFCSYFGFLLAVGWDYVDGVSIAFIALTNLALVASTRSRYWLACLAVSGFMFAAAVSAQIFAMAFTPVMALTYAATSRHKSLRRHIFGIGSSILGAGSLVILLGVANHWMGGDFNYFLPTLQFANAYEQQPNLNQVAQSDLFTYLFNQSALQLPALMTIASIGLALATSRRSFAAVTGWFYAEFLLAVAIMLGTHVFTHQPVFEYPYYVSYLIPWMFLAVGGLLAPLIGILPWRHIALVLAATVAGIILAATRSLDTFAASDLRWPLFIGVALVATSSLAFRIRRKRTDRWAATVALATTVVFAAAFAAWSVRAYNEVRLNLTPYHVGSGSGAADGADGLATVVDTYRFLHSVDPQARIWLWYDHDAVDGGLYRSIASTYLWGYRLVGERFPELGGPPFGDESVQLSVIPYKRIAILSDGDDAIEEARTTLANYGLALRPEYQTRVQHGPYSVEIATAQLVPLESAAGQYWAADWTQGWQPASEANVLTVGPTEVEIQTRPSQYDWQLISDPIAVHPRSRYLVKMQVKVDAGGVGVGVVSPDLTEPPVVLGVHYWNGTTQALSQYADAGFFFDAGDMDHVRIIVTNGSLANPAASTFRIRGLGLWEQGNGA